MKKKQLSVSKRKTVLVTGANGLLGGNIIHQLNGSDKYRARAMVRKGADMRSLHNADFDLFEGNITNPRDLSQALEGCDFVIHCAASTRQYPSDLAYYREVNIDSTVYLLKLCLEKGIKRFVFVSTPNCFTNGSRLKPGTEESDFMPWLKKSGYAYSKYLAQQQVLKYVHDYNFPAVVVAPGFLIGPLDAKPSSGQLVLYSYKNKVIFCPPGGKSFVDAEYAAEATIKALSEGAPGSIWLLTGKNITYREFFKIVRKLSGKRKWIIPLPVLLLQALARLSDAVQVLFKRPMPFNSTNQKLLCLDNYFSNEKAMRELGLKPTCIESATRKAIVWFKNNGYIA